MARRKYEVRQKLEAAGREFFGAAFRAQVLILEPLVQVMAPERAEDGFELFAALLEAQGQ